MKSLYQAVIRQKHPIQLGDCAYLHAHYEPAGLQQGGRVIKPPRYIWLLHEGITDNKQAVHIVLENNKYRRVLEKGLRSNQSFEWAPLGMFFKRENGFELLLASANTHRTGPNYGLPSLNLQPIKAPKASSEQSDVKKKFPKWWLQVAAAVLFIVLLNVMVLTYLSHNGALTFRQTAEVSLLDNFSSVDEFEKPLAGADSVLTLVQGASPAGGQTTEVSVNAKEVNSRSTISSIHMTKESVYAQQFSKSKPIKNIPPKTKIISAVSKQKGEELAVVVGAFQSSENAAEMVKSLNAKGFAAKEIASTTGKWFRVVVVSERPKSESDIFLQEIKSKINQQSWILAE